MRKQSIRYAMTAFRFRRWSRKRYAAFISRQRTFTMGTLRCNVVERLLKKGVSAVSAGESGRGVVVAGEAAGAADDFSRAFLFPDGGASFLTGAAVVGGFVAPTVFFRRDIPAAAVSCRPSTNYCIIKAESSWFSNRNFPPLFFPEQRRIHPEKFPATRCGRSESGRESKLCRVLSAAG